MIELHHFTVAYFLQQTVNGLSLGCIYALIALGYTMVYGIIGKINFAHGEIYMIGAYLTFIGYTTMKIIGVPTILAFVLVLFLMMAINSLWGFALERIAYRPLRNAPRLAPLITAIGASIFLQNFVQNTQGTSTKNLHLSFGSNIKIWESNEFIATINPKQLITFLITAVLLAVFTWIINKTKLGRHQRATQQDQLMASLMGINVDRVISITFMMGASLAAVAGFTSLLYYGSIDFSIGFLAGIKAFTAAVLGGIGSLPGAVLGGLLIGLIESYWATFFGSELKDVAAFSILVILLIFRPSGIFGRPEVEKV